MQGINTLKNPRKARKNWHLVHQYGTLDSGRWARLLLKMTDFLWGRGYPCFGLLVMSPLGFKARVSSPINSLGSGIMSYMFQSHLWCNTCWSLGRQHGGQPVLLHIPTSRHWWGSKLGSLILPLPHSVRPGRCSTDWAMWAWLKINFPSDFGLFYK